jgi:hypothetical protein
MTINPMFDIFMSSDAAFTPERWDEYISVVSKKDPIGDISDTREIIKKPWGTWTDEEKIRFDKVWIYIFQNYIDK